MSAGMLSDIRYAFRSLRHSRGFTAAALIALALGIGANTAMFSVVYSVLLKPLPYRAPDRLVWVAYYNKRFKMELVTGPDFIDWRAQSRSFDPMAASGARDRTLTAIAEPFDIRTTAFSESLGRLFGVQPVLGRDFLPQELLPGAASRPAIISDRFFRRFFHGDRAALGATLVLDNEPITVVGVLPADFRLALPSPFGPQVETDAILPLVLDPAQQRRDARGVTIVQVVGRLRPGVFPGRGARGVDGDSGTSAAASLYPRKRPDPDDAALAGSPVGQHRTIDGDSAGRSGVCSADRLRERGESALDAGRGATSRDRGADGAGRKSRQAGAASVDGKPAAGTGRRRCRLAAGGMVPAADRELERGGGAAPTGCAHSTQQCWRSLSRSPRSPESCSA